MNKCLIGLGIACVLGLSACGDNSSNKDDPIFQEPETPDVEQPFVRVVFNPGMGDINIPNDLLMIPEGQFFDFTLNTEGEESFDLSNPKHTLSALDGWSVHYPMSIRVESPEGKDIDPNTVDASSIRIFKATQALEGTSEACLTAAAQLAAPGLPCELGPELVYGEDFIASYVPGSNAISVVPLKVLDASQGHLLVITESLTDLEGRPVKGSGTWDLVRQDITTNQVGVEALVPLQVIVNSMVNLLAVHDIPRESFSYGAYFTTQSVDDSLTTIKTLHVAPYAEAFSQTLTATGDPVTASTIAKQYLPSIKVAQNVSVTNTFEAIGPVLLGESQYAELMAVGLHTCQGLIESVTDTSSPLHAVAAATFAEVGAFCAANIVKGEVNLPYYLDPSAPKSGWWKAACTSGATLKLLGEEVITSLIQAGQVGPYNALCQLASDNQLMDLDLTSLGMSDPRNITKYSPIPMPRGRAVDDSSTPYNEMGTENIQVHITVPNESVIAVLSAATQGAIPMIEKPTQGWPVVLFQHGIAGEKENVLALSAAFSLAGYVTIGIDHPLHGERGLEDAEGNLIVATMTSIENYLNFGSLLTGRDNAKQSASDIMGLRLAMNNLMDLSGNVEINPTEVHFIGHSLGSITGTAALSVANTSLGGELANFDHLYGFSTAVLNVPAGGVPSFILESPDFGPLVKGGLLAASSEEFVQYLTAYATSNGQTISEAMRGAFTSFISNLPEPELTTINQTFRDFGFAAQTVLDSIDPISYAHVMADNTPTLAQLLVGGGTNDDGSTAVSDEANLVTTSLPLVGGQPLADLLGLEKISATANNEGVVRMLSGNHFSLFIPDASVAATQELQSQAVSFFKSNGTQVIIANPDVVEN